MIINHVGPSGLYHGCTVGSTEIIVEHSTISQWYMQVGAIRELTAVTMPPTGPASTSSTPFSATAQSAG